MLNSEEIKIFAWMLKQLGGKIKIPYSELEALTGWLVEFNHGFEDMSFHAKLTRVGTTIEGEASGLHDPAAPSRGGLRPQQPRLSMRHAFLAQESKPGGDREVPPAEET